MGSKIMTRQELEKRITVTLYERTAFMVQFEVR